MTRIIITLMLSLFLSSNASAQARCGFKPMTPFGCKSESAKCTCTVKEDGTHCEWVFDDCR